MARTRVVFALNNLGLGGIEHHLCRQLVHFDRTRFEPFLVLLSSGSIGAHPPLPEDVALHRFAFKGIWDVREYRRLSRLLSEIRPDIVVSSVFDANTIMRVLQPFYGYAHIAREHSVTVGKPRWQYLVDRLLSSRSFTTIGVSKAVADYAAAHSSIPQGRFTVIYNGVDLDEVRETSRDTGALMREFGIAEGERVILSVGRLKEQKNQQLLIEGFALFASSHPEWKVLLVGDGKDRPMLERLAKERGVGGRVIFAGVRSDVMRFYPLATLSVITSPLEGFPNSAIESFAFGVPLVSTRAGGVVEAVENSVNGFLVDSTPESVAAGLEKIAAQTEDGREHMRAACRETAKTFSLSENVRAYEALFDRALQSRV